MQSEHKTEEYCIFIYPNEYQFQDMTDLLLRTGGDANRQHDDACNWDLSSLQYTSLVQQKCTCMHQKQLNQQSLNSHYLS